MVGSDQFGDTPCWCKIASPFHLRVKAAVRQKTEGAAQQNQRVSPQIYTCPLLPCAPAGALNLKNNQPKEAAQPTIADGLEEETLRALLVSAEAAK